MASEDGFETHSLIEALAADPYRFDFYHAVRSLEALHPTSPRVGNSLRAVDDPVRFCQQPSLRFDPATLVEFRQARENSPQRMFVAFLGLLGPMGPLPLHMTEYVRERLLHNGDATLARFLDLFHHRLGLFFYRAWAEARPTVHQDRPGEDRFTVYVGSLAGHGLPGSRARDMVPDHAKRFFVAHLARGPKNAEGLASILEGFFRLPTRVDQLEVGWLALPKDQRTALGGASRLSSMLGQDTVVGERVRDVQSRFRIVMGPMDLDRFGDFLPGRPSLERLRDWVRNYVGFEFDWDVQLVLSRDEVPGILLGREGQLGWTTWLGARRAATDADDLTLAPERSRPRPTTLAAA